MKHKINYMSEGPWDPLNETLLAPRIGYTGF